MRTSFHHQPEALTQRRLLRRKETEDGRKPLIFCVHHQSRVGSRGVLWGVRVFP